MDSRLRGNNGKRSELKLSCPECLSRASIFCQKQLENEIVIRQAGVHDIPQMCGLLAGLFSIETDFSPDMGKQSAGLMLLLGDPDACLLVAEAAGGLIGMCSVQKVISTAEGGYSGLLEDLFVSATYRGQGVGTRLLSHAIKWCEINDLSRVQLLADKENTKALEFYKSRGWGGTKMICLRKK